MARIIKNTVVAIGFLLLSFVSRAEHLVGGELSYRCMGNNRYEVVLTVFRDCNSLGADFDAPAFVTVFNGDNDSVQQVLRIFFSSRRRLANTPPNNCTRLPSAICTEMAIYRDTVRLPPRPGGYHLSYQRCCRNSSISNVFNSADWGSTYTTHIPTNDVGCNSSPSFNSLPPTALCLNVPVTIDLAATDPDGDSLVYRLCSPLHGGGKQAGTGFFSPKPSVALPPPYTQVPFRNGFSATAPIPSQPALQLNPANGNLFLRPTQVGQYAFAVCVSELRNGQVINTVMRDFQFNVSGACQGTTAFIEPQGSLPNALCSGRTIAFRQNSLNAQSFLWNFGEPGTQSDTSRLPNPTYTYRDTGLYRVQLIANPRSSCPDTTESIFAVYDSLAVDFQIQGSQCFEDHSLSLTVNGSFTNQARYQWDFGGLTNRGFGSSSLQPDNLQYNQPGTYVIRLRIEEFACSATATDTIVISRRPQLAHLVPAVQGCAPVEVQFLDQSTGSDLVHFWDFGDGRASREASPSHVYDSAGLFTVRHRIYSVTGCVDTLEEIFTNRIEVWPVPESKLTVSPKEIDFNSGPFQVAVHPSPDANRTRTWLPDGRQIENLDSTWVNLANDTGTFPIVTVAYNEYGCTDTALAEIKIRQPLVFKIPNAFTPNGDGLNDVFSYRLSGVRSHQIVVYNRWGEIVFSSTDMNQTWDATQEKSGKPVPAGVYAYRLQARVIETNQDLVQSGTITVIR